MSTGNLTDLGGYQQPRAVENLLGNSLPAPLRGVASTSNIWDSQVMTFLFLRVVLFEFHDFVLS